ncbi:MAG: SRPBCC family protein [Arachnia sp.]
MVVLDSYSARTAHAAEAVFSRWADPQGWPEWDAGVQEVRFAGPAKIGAQGRMRPASGPVTTFTVTAFEPERVFTNTSSLPGGKLVFEHLVTPIPGGASVEVTVRVDGLLASVWQRFLGRGLGNAARSSVTGLLTHLDAA